MISFRDLGYFAAAAQSGNATRAADALNVSQPAISAAIRKLELEFGQKLFHRRQARGLELTEFGEHKLREAREILDSVAAMSARSEAMPTRRIVLGYFSTLGPTWVPGALGKLTQTLPDLDIELRECDLDEISHGLTKGLIDMAITYDVGLPNGVEKETLTEIVPHAIVAPSHPLARRDHVTLADLARFPLILIDLPISREFLMVPFWQRGLSPKIALRTRSVEMARCMVANGHGVSLLFTRPRHDRTDDGKRIIRKRVRDPTLTQRLVIAFNPSACDKALKAGIIAALHAHMDSALRL